MNAEDRHLRAMKDYNRLCELHNGEDVFEYLSGFNIEAYVKGLMEAPTKSTAAYIYESLIEYAASSGFEPLRLGRGNGVIRRSREVLSIFERYGHEVSDSINEF